MPVDRNSVGNTGCCTCGAGPCLSCCPCGIPETTLIASWSGGTTGLGGLAYYATGSVNLTYDGAAHQWTGPCVPFQYNVGTGLDASWIIVRFKCQTSNGIVYLQVDEYNSSACSGYIGGVTTGNGYTLGAFACNPFSIAQTANTAIYPGLPSFTIAGPPGVNCSIPSSSTFTVTGCNGLALSGVTVNVYDSLGGALLASGTTDSSGNCLLSWSGPCTVYVTATEGTGRFTAWGQSVTVASLVSISLAVAAGYTCISGCAYPLNNTLHFTSTLFGNFGLVNVGGMTWATSGPHFVSTIAFCGCTAVVACPFGITFSGASHAIGMQWDIANAPPAPNGCPSTSGPAPGTSGTATIACPPSFSASLTVVGAATCTSGINMNYTAAMFGPGGTDTWMITE